MDKIKEIFERIDEIIKDCMTDKPVKLKESNFYLKYLELKGEYNGR